MMRQKRWKWVAAALPALFSMAVLAPPADAAKVNSSDEKIQSGVIQQTLHAGQRAPLGNFDAKADERLRRVVKILRTTDKTQVNQFVPVAFELKNVNPFAVIRFVRRVVEVEEGNWWTFVAPDGNSGRLLVNVPVWQVEPLKELVALIDRPGLTSSDGSVRVYHQLNHRNPADPGFVSTLAGLGNPTATILPDVATGAVYLEDAQSGIDLILSFMEKLDAPTGVVYIQSKIYELDRVNDGTLGLDFHAWKNGPGRNLFSLTAFREYFKIKGRGEPLVIDPGSDNVDIRTVPGRRFVSHGYSGNYFYELPSAYFDFLVDRGRARVLTAPRVVVGNGKTASFTTGEQILYYRVQNGPAEAAGTLPAGVVLDPLGDDSRFPDNRTVTGMTTPRAAPAVADASVRMDVTNRMNGVATVYLNLDLSIVSHLGFDGEGAPLLSARRISEEIDTKYGEEHILGGMTRTQSIQTTRKVPILGSIPVLGYLFGGEITTAKKTELAALVKADAVEEADNLGPAEEDVMDRVETPGMDSVPLPEQLVGFDMMLLGQ